MESIGLRGISSSAFDMRNVCHGTTIPAQAKGLCIGLRVDVTEKSPFSVIGWRSLHIINASC